MSELNGTNGTKTAPSSGTPHQCEAVALVREQSYLLYDQDHEPAPPAASLEKTNDPVRMYLREMGTVPLLTRQGEVEIAKRIEKGQKGVIKALFRSPVLVGEISKYGERLRKNGLSIKHLVQLNGEELTDAVLEKRRKDVSCHARMGDPIPVLPFDFAGYGDARIDRNKANFPRLRRRFGAQICRLDRHESRIHFLDFDRGRGQGRDLLVR